MSFLRKIGEKLGIVEEESKTEKLRKERDGIKKTLADNLKLLNFTESEIDEVIAVIEKTEDEIQKRKDELIGTNINNPNPNEIMKEIFQEIRDLEMQMGLEVKAKIAEIKTRKGM